MRPCSWGAAFNGPCPCVGFVREVVPDLRRLAIMANVGNPASVLEMGEVQTAARRLGLEVTTSEIRRRHCRHSISLLTTP